MSDGDLPRAESSASRSAVLIVLVVAIAIAVVTGVVRDRAGAPDPSVRGRQHERSEEGSACALLFRAWQLREAGDDQAFASAVREASRAAERTLQRSGEVFGPPERWAIELEGSLADGDPASVASRLDRAARACASLGRWPGSP